MLSRLFRHRDGTFKEKVPEQVLPQAPIPELVYVPPVIMKTKKWVVHGTRIGIIADLSEYGFAEVHYTDKNGLTVDTHKKVRVGELRVARWEEIPLSRRPKDRLTANSLGYY